MTNELVSSLLSVAAFLAVIAITGFGAAALRRRARTGWPASSGRRLVLRNRLSLGDRNFIAVVELDDTELVVAGSPAGLSLLLTRPTATSADSVDDHSTATSALARPVLMKGQGSP